jgi:hypothetical protein
MPVPVTVFPATARHRHFVRSSAANASKLVAVLCDCGFAATRRSTASSSWVLTPYRLDRLPSISGVDFDDAWSDRLVGELDGTTCSIEQPLQHWAIIRRAGRVTI